MRLDSSTRAKMVKFSKPKVDHARTGVTSTCIEKMELLDQLDPRRLKLKPDNKANCHTHSCKHFPNLLKTPWRVNSSVKKVNHGEVITLCET